MTALLNDADLIDRILSHVDGQSTDKGTTVWREPAANYISPERFAAELEVLRRVPMAFCPSAALPEPGSYDGRHAASGGAGDRRHRARLPQRLPPSRHEARRGRGL